MDRTAASRSPPKRWALGRGGGVLKIQLHEKWENIPSLVFWSLYNWRSRSEAPTKFVPQSVYTSPRRVTKRSNAIQKALDVKSDTTSKWTDLTVTQINTAIYALYSRAFLSWCSRTLGDPRSPVLPSKTDYIRSRGPEVSSP